MVRNRQSVTVANLVAVSLAWPVDIVIPGQTVMHVNLPGGTGEHEWVQHTTDITSY
jgi:hypothetical protein